MLKRSFAKYRLYSANSLCIILDSHFVDECYFKIFVECKLIGAFKRIIDNNTLLPIHSKMADLYDYKNIQDY